MGLGYVDADGVIDMWFMGGSLSKGRLEKSLVLGVGANGWWVLCVSEAANTRWRSGQDNSGNSLGKEGLYISTNQCHPVFTARKT